MGEGRIGEVAAGEEERCGDADAPGEDVLLPHRCSPC